MSFGVVIPPDAVIPVAKLTKYLLVPRLEDDKSKFLAKGGFTLQNHAQLERAIRAITAQQPAFFDGVNKFGEFFRVDGELRGPLATLQVSLIWIQLADDRKFHFVTLKPYKA